MADLLAKQDFKTLHRGQEVEGTILAILPEEIILDIGGKAEGTLSKKELSEEQLINLKVGGKLSAFVTYPENESGQVVLGLYRSSSRTGTNTARFAKFEQALKTGQTLIGKGVEVNKGGLVVEIAGIRGFIPTSQLALSYINNLEDLIGRDIKIKVIEIDALQNKLIFTQIIELPAEAKAKLGSLKVGSSVEGKIDAILTFGLVLKLENGLAGLVHISEVSWEKIEDLNSRFKLGEEEKAMILLIDEATGRINLSFKQLQEDPFAEIAKKYQADDIIKVEVSKVTANGVILSLEGGIEGFIPSNKLESDATYNIGDKISCIVDSVDAQRRRVNLAPFITSTKDLIYK